MKYLPEKGTDVKIGTKKYECTVKLQTGKFLPLRQKKQVADKLSRK